MKGALCVVPLPDAIVLYRANILIGIHGARQSAVVREGPALEVICRSVSGVEVTVRLRERVLVDGGGHEC